MISPDLVLFNECFTFDVVGSKLLWKVRPKHHFQTEGQWKLFNSKFPGKEAGYIKKDGRTHYRVVKIAGDTIHVHRVVYCMVNSTTEIDEIDHIDGNGLNNNPLNLRSVSRKINSMNQRLFTNNKTGICGVSWCKAISRFFVTYRDEGLARTRSFDNLFDAACFRKSHELKVIFGENHGKV